MRLLIPALAAALLAAPTLSAELPREAIPLSFRTHDGKQVSLSDLKGKAVAVMFFSTDCPHCQHTAEILSPIYEEFKGQGFEVCGLAVNPSAVANLNEFVANHKVTFPVGLGNTDQWTKFADLSATARPYVPHLLFVDKQGRIVEDHPGLDRQFWLNQETLIREAVERLTSE